MYRQDAWTNREDELLATIILSNIKDNKTQLNSFEEVGEKINRTSAACGFRWNSALRHQYKDEIRIAKEERMLNKRDTVNKKTDKPIISSESNFTQNIDILISTVNKIKDEYLHMQETIRKMKNKITELTIELEEAKKQNRPLTATEDLDSLIKILHRAEEMGVFNNMKINKKPAI
ncbi:RsfA family transcriptional regulator [Paenibacillus sp. NRS-1775]|uniref:RsfA family transcriptional regulator n=1 Tax=unclassified Paenibacillus TaxID=185978 RepID=UPI003D274338